MSKKGKYDNEFKVQALKLKKEAGLEEAATQLGINRETLKYWDRWVRNGTLRLENSDISPEGGKKKGKISFCCRMLGVTRKGFRKCFN